MFKGVDSNIKLLLASVTITVIGLLLPWVAMYETPIRGIHLRYGTQIFILLIIILMVVHISKKMLSSILIIILSSLAVFIVLQSFVEVSDPTQSPSFFSLSTGGIVTGIGAIGMMLSGISGIISERDKRANR